MKGSTSAGFVSTFVSQQAKREQQTAHRFLSGRQVSSSRFMLVASAFGSNAAVLLDANGRVLGVAPSSRKLIGQPIAGRYPHLEAAEQGRVAASNVVPSAARGVPVVAIAVPVATSYGRRVFSAAYPIGASVLEAFVAHTVAYPQHKVYLVDSAGRLLAASPATSLRSVGEVDPALERALHHSAHGVLGDGRTPSTYTSAPVPGTSWRLLIAVPDSRLYASVRGLPVTLSWLVLALVGLLGSLLVALLTRSLIVRGQLATEAAITRTMNEGVVLVGAEDACILFTNSSFDAMLGYEAGELLGKPASLISARGERGWREGFEHLAERLREEGTWSGETENLAKDGTALWCMTNITTLDHSEYGRVWVAVHSDVSARKRAEAAAMEARDKAIEASRVKSDFVANMSHEIRTPLNGVLGMADLLRDGPLDPVQREHVQALGVSGEALLSVINNVLDFSKLEAGHVELDRTDFALRACVEDACQMLAGEAHRKGLEISHWIDADVPATVSGDRVRLRQILLNLLSNAVKFTATGEVVVRVSRLDQDQVRFGVSDTGVGVAQVHSSRLFEAFVQADQSTTREYGGTGLGLAISRELTQRMDGEIGVQRRESGGSEFWFTAKLPEVAAPADLVRPELEGLRTLIVDDNATNRTILESYLTNWGLSCTVVDGPELALAELERAASREQPFQLAVLDFNMPGMNGTQLAAQIRARPALRALRILILSSSQLDPAQLAGNDISATLTKPARQADIRDAILGAFAKTAPPAGAQLSVDAVPNERGLLVLVAEDNEINRTVAEAFLVKRGLHVAFAHNGREAVEKAAGHNYAAIFMDCQMPDVDGFEATRQIRLAENAGRVPIIAMTALSMPGDQDRCLAAGMDDYLSKPLRTDDLDQVLRRWVSHDGASDVSGSTAGRAPVGLETVLDAATVEQLRSSLAVQMRQELLATFEEQQQTSVELIATAVGRSDLGEVRRVAHQLKGSSASLGASRLRLCCQRLEHTGRDEDSAIAPERIEELRAVAAATSSALRRQLV